MVDSARKYNLFYTAIQVLEKSTTF